MNYFVSLKNKWIRSIAKTCSLATVAFIFQACYGPPPSRYDRDIDIKVKVINKEGNPISGIDVNVNDFITQQTNGNGFFNTFSPRSEKYKITVLGNDMYASRDTVITEAHSNIDITIVLANKK